MSQVSLQQLVDYFKEANAKFFNNYLKLDMKFGYNGIKIDITTRATKRLGVFIAKDDRKKIVFSDYILRNDLYDDHGTLEWKNTMVHEMVHAYQYFTFAKVDHGPGFHHKAAVIKRIDPKMVIDTLASGKQLSALIQDRDRKKKGPPSVKPRPTLSSLSVDKSFYILYIKDSKKYYFVSGSFPKSSLTDALNLAKRSSVFITMYEIKVGNIPKAVYWNEYDSLIDLKADVISSNVNGLTEPYGVDFIKKKFNGDPDSALVEIYNWKK